MLLIDAIPGGRIRGRLGSSLWVVFGLAAVWVQRPLALQGARAFFTVFMVGALVGWGLGALVVRTVRCPHCRHRVLWDRYNDSEGLAANPYRAERCQRCDFEPGAPR